MLTPLTQRFDLVATQHTTFKRMIGLVLDPFLGERLDLQAFTPSAQVLKSYSHPTPLLDLSECFELTAQGEVFIHLTQDKTASAIRRGIWQLRLTSPEPQDPEDPELVAFIAFFGTFTILPSTAPAPPLAPEP